MQLLLRAIAIFAIVLGTVAVIALATGIRITTKEVVICTDKGERRIKDVPLCTPDILRKHGG